MKSFNNLGKSWWTQKDTELYTYYIKEVRIFKNAWSSGKHVNRSHYDYIMIFLPAYLHLTMLSTNSSVNIGNFYVFENVFTFLLPFFLLIRECDLKHRWVLSLII